MDYQTKSILRKICAFCLLVAFRYIGLGFGIRERREKLFAGV